MNIEEIFTYEKLYEAHLHCRCSKQHKGEVVRFETNLSENLYKIVSDMKSKKYKLGKYKKFYIYEPKERLIEALPYKDRVMIRCFCENVIKPKIEPKLIYDNTACRKGKGSSFAINRLEKFLRREYIKENNNEIYFLKCDISKYFPSINHDVLKNLLNKINFTDDEIWLINKLIDEQPDGATIGLPLGNQSSQWFALLYLNTIDRFIKEQLQIKCYVRYMDDMILIHRDKKYLQKCLYEIEKVCNEKLKLSLNSKTQIGKVQNGIDFLEFRHVLTPNGKIIRKMRQSSKIRMKKHLKTLNKLRKKEIVDDEYVYVRKNAFYNHIKDSNESLYFISQVLVK